MSNKDPVRIQINVPGRQPEVIEDVAMYALVTVPYEKADQNSAFHTNMGQLPKRIAEIGMWMIRLAKFMDEGGKGKPPAIGDDPEPASRILKAPGRKGIVKPYNHKKKIIQPR
jgi:hypothetical protein